MNTIFEKSAPILMQIGTIIGVPIQMHETINFEGQRSKVNNTRGWGYVWSRGGGIVIDPIGPSSYVRLLIGV